MRIFNSSVHIHARIVYVVLRRLHKVYDSIPDMKLNSSNKISMYDILGLKDVFSTFQGTVLSPLNMHCIQHITVLLFKNK